MRPKDWKECSAVRRGAELVRGASAQVVVISASVGMSVAVESPCKDACRWGWSCAGTTVWASAALGVGGWRREASPTRRRYRVPEEDARCCRLRESARGKGMSSGRSLTSRAGVFAR